MVINNDQPNDIESILSKMHAGERLQPAIRSVLKKIGELAKEGATYEPLPWSELNQSVDYLLRDAATCDRAECNERVIGNLHVCIVGLLSKLNQQIAKPGAGDVL